MQIFTHQYKHFKQPYQEMYNNMKKQKEPKIITTSFVIFKDGSMKGTSMYRHHYRKEKIRRLFLLENIP